MIREPGKIYQRFRPIPGLPAGVDSVIGLTASPGTIAVTVRKNRLAGQKAYSTGLAKCFRTSVLLTDILRHDMEIGEALK